MDGRYSRLRPRTRQGENELNQPLSWQGTDPMAARTTTPVRTFETPLITFPAEITVPINSNRTIPLPKNCAQIAFIGVKPGCFASINGGGARTIKDGFIYSGEFYSLQVATDATGTATIQLAAY